MAVGLPTKVSYANGDVFSSSDINDTNGTINLIGQTLNLYAGKNKIINGDFGVWQRGTSFTVGAGFGYTTDRFGASINGTGVCTISRQTFTPGTAPVTGYESQFFLRSSKTAGTANTYGGLVNTRIEDVRTLANQSVTLSFWAKADSSITISAYLDQNFGSGGSAGVSALAATNYSLTTSWQRFTTTFTMPSISGKTVGTSSYLDLGFFKLSAAAYVVDMWGVQLESGSTATAFQTATGTIQGELAACQRYYNRYTATGVYSSFASSAFAQSTTAGTGLFAFPVEMRIAPTAIDSSTLAFSKWDNTHYAMSSVTLDSATTSTKNAYVYGTGSGMTAGNIGYFGANNLASAYIGFSAEL
jgi:hypothetical protein